MLIPWGKKNLEAFPYGKVRH